MTAAERGHDVTLYEKADRLGGVLAHFCADDYLKREMLPYRDSQIRKVMKSGCRILLNTEATPEMLKQEHYDVIISAVGAREKRISVPGAELPHVCNILEMPDKEALGDTVAIIGGGMAGCETAYDLAVLGKKVLLIEMQDKLFPETDTVSKKYSMPVFVRISRHENIRILRSAECVAIGQGTLTVRTAGGEEQVLPADSVIYSVGSKADTEFVDALWDCAPDVVPVGDCVRARSIIDAVREAYFAARNI